MTDEMILELIHSPGEREEGFRQLVVHYQQRLYGVIRRQVKEHQDADDILQNTFLKVFRHIGNFEGRSGLFTWLYRIACNEVITYQQQSNRRKTTVLDDHTPQEAEAFVDVDGLTQRLEKAITSLPERQQMVFRMRYYDELTYKEMADILQLTEGALKASFHHAVKKIEQEFRTQQIL